MKKILILVFLIKSFDNAFCQSAATPYPSILQVPFETSHGFISVEEGVEGSPLLFDNWRPGIVKLKNHTQYDNVRLNFVPSVNKFYFNFNDSSHELANTVVEVRIKDLNYPDNRDYDMVFKNNINGGKVLKPGTFVEVLNNGKIGLFKEYIKEAEGRNSTNGIVTSAKKYVLHINIFAIIDDNVIAGKENEHFLKQLTSDRKDQMKAFVRLHKLNLKKEADFKLAISYYNYISSTAFSKKVSV